MRRFFLSIPVLVLLTLSACNDNASRQVQSEQDGREQEGNMPTDSSGYTNNLDRPSNPDSTNQMGSTAVNSSTGQYTADSIASGGKGRVQTTGDAEAFLREAAVANLTEIRSSELARKTSSNAEVKRFAEMMIAHHQKNMAELKPLAARNGVVLPTDLTPEKKQELGKLTTATGSAFDRAYVDLQVKAHQQTVGKFETIGASIGDTDVNAYVEKTLPVVRHHLQLAEALQGKMGKSADAQ
jgi:putative membrane protein